MTESTTLASRVHGMSRITRPATVSSRRISHSFREASMKSFLPWIGLSTLALGSQALASEPVRAFTAVDSEPRFMIYVQHAFGAAKNTDSGPRLGFSIDRHMPIALQSDSLTV